jgi:hypothetical protein
MENNKEKKAVQAKKEDDWKLEGSGEASDPNLNVCESCQ